MDEALLNEALLISAARQAVSDGTVARVRQSFRLSQGEFAAVVGVSRPCVTRWEQFDRMPSRRNALKLGKFLRKAESVR